MQCTGSHSLNNCDCTQACVLLLSTHATSITLQVGKTYSGPREALQLTGKFVSAHLLEAAKAGPNLSSSPFVLGLHQQVSTSQAD